MLVEFDLKFLIYSKEEKVASLTDEESAKYIMLFLLWFILIHL